MPAAEPSTCPNCEIHAESVFRVEGMDCQDEVTLLERRLGRLAGLEALSADLMGQKLRVTHDAARLSTSTIVDAVAQTGMSAWLEHERPLAQSGLASRRRLAVLLSGAALALGVAMQLADLSATLVRPAFGLAVLAGGIFTIRRAMTSARSASIDIHVLMTIAVSGAIVIGEWAEAATVMFLFALAQMLESSSLDRARGAIRALMDLSPLEARVRRGDGERTVPVDRVRVGERVVVRPGEKIPLDGTIATGSSYVNQAPITGESLPVDKRPGDEVFAGTLNGRGALEIEVTRQVRDTTLARIIHLVERAQAQRAPSQTFVDRFSRVYTPAVVALAVLIACVPPLVLGEPFGGWVYRALVLLVISCPCALVISTPVSVVSALAAAARHGVLIKGGIHLERTGAVDCIAFDKTGTLTAGRLNVDLVRPVEGVDEDDLLRTAAAVEARSEHPIARAIVRDVRQRGLPIGVADDFQAVPGRGAHAAIGGVPVSVGNQQWFEERNICTPAVHDEIETLARRGAIPVLVARDGRTIGLIGVADEARESSADAIALLRQLGITHLVLLTGDLEAGARGVSRELGLDEYRAGLLPEDKVAAVEALRERYGTVLMVGDGVNDAPALAAADVGIAMGVAGSDAALETADIALMADELLKIPFVVRLSRATVRNIKINVLFSLGLKAAVLVLAVLGLATLWMAVVADMGASLLVIANGLRLMRSS
jgi:Cd2+/Zn2+-exporting ATPase